MYLKLSKNNKISNTYLK